MHILMVAALLGAVYKCTADGKTSYSDAPCPAGSDTAVLEAPAAPTANPIASTAAGASITLSQQRKQADAMEQARHKREDRDQRDSAAAAKAAAAQRKKCDQLKLKQRWADEDVRRTAGPATEAVRLRAQRAAEATKLECPH